MAAACIVINHLQQMEKIYLQEVNIREAFANGATFISVVLLDLRALKYIPRIQVPIVTNV